MVIFFGYLSFLEQICIKNQYKMSLTIILQKEVDSSMYIK